MAKIFISYSSKDSQITYKIYSDLLRTGANIYLFERERNAGIDFEQEIYSKIDKADFFCLIDSENSRKSAWVNKECSYALSNENRLKSTIIPCLIQSKDKWFYNKEIFFNQKLIRGLDFSNLNYLDYKEKYKKAIVQLCSLMGLEYDPWSETPQDRDFEKELSTYDIDFERREFYLNDYKNFKHAIHINSVTKKARIKHLLLDCENNGLKLITCYLALGNIYSEENNTKKTLEIYKKCTRLFPKDARSWAALSGVYFFLKNFNNAFKSIEKTLNIIAEYPKNKYLQRHLNEIVLNKIQILICLKKYKSARNLLKKYSLFSKTPDYKLINLKLKLLAQNKLSNKSYNYIKKNYSNYNINPSNLNFKIADLEFCIGEFYSKKSNFKKALVHFREAYNINHSSIKYLANCFLVEKVLNIFNKRTTLKYIIQKNISNEEEYYYLGLIYYLCNKKIVANNLYKNNNQNNWCYYNKII